MPDLPDAVSTSPHNGKPTVSNPALTQLSFGLGPGDYFVHLKSADFNKDTSQRNWTSTKTFGPFNFSVPVVNFETSTSMGPEGQALVTLTIKTYEDDGITPMTPVNPVSVDFTINQGLGTATQGTDPPDMVDDDYLPPVLGTATFAAGVTSSTTFTFSVVDDTRDEPDETVVFELSNPVGALIGDHGLHTYTIVDDDIAININDVGELEGTGATACFEFTVTLSKAFAQTVTVEYSTKDGTAVSASDYQATTGTLTFVAGVTAQTMKATMKLMAAPIAPKDSGWTPSSQYSAVSGYRFVPGMKNMPLNTKI